ncbi:MAG: polyphosphate kinase 1 [Rikenellaceae bacterium]|nr:polyphosphate kinase 1 [Rikenellaceae bacterium]
MLFNRELSWLLFNERVLQEAQDESVPLIQRLRFLGIYSNNLDEFYKVRVANLERLVALTGRRPKRLSGDYAPAELLDTVREKISLLHEKYEATYHHLLKEMEREGIEVVNERELTDEQQQFVWDYFASTVSIRTVPLMLRKRNRLPFLRDDRSYLAIKMWRSKGRANVRYAIIEIPVSSACPRFVTLPSPEGKIQIIFLDDILRFCLDEIFFMFDYDEITAHAFKLTRDAELTLDDDISKSLIQKMEQGIDKRMHGRPIRLVYDREMPRDLLDLITSKFGLTDGDNVNAGGRYHFLRDLMKFPRVAPALEYPRQVPLLHPGVKKFSSILSVIKKKDLLVAYPYQSFTHLLDFLREAAIDPYVESIFITIYRVAERSKVISALTNAARNGKRVVALVELMARFDEERNIEFTDTLQEAGVKVIHGIEGLKVHSKLILVQRREGSRLKGYTHIGTGNFNEDTATLYSDFSLFTANDAIAADAAKVFDFLQHTHRHFECRELIVSPYFMRDFFVAKIAREIHNAEAGRPAYIYAKFNSLTDEDMIYELYRASMAGVEVRLIVRGACCLMPGVEGLSEHIRAISIVDKFLEHSRIIIFGNGGDEQAYIASADWMARNLNRRVEVGVPILDKELRRTLRDFFDIQWADTEKARDLSNFAENRYVGAPAGTPQVRAQEAIYEYLEKK